MNATPSSHTFPSLVKSVLPLGREERTRRAGEMSFQKSLIELFANKEVDRRERKFFKKRWQIFLLENFDSPAHVALCFSVSAQTADNWWNGFNAPEGPFVAKALTNPATAKQARKHLTWGTDSTAFAAE